jgi:hypothetical protein
MSVLQFFEDSVLSERQGQGYKAGAGKEKVVERYVVAVTREGNTYCAEIL